MKPFHSFLPEFLRKAAGNEEAALTFLDSLWTEIVGLTLSSRCSPVRLENRELTLAVPTENWKRELTEMSSIMILSINKFWGLKLVETINFEVHQTNC